MRQLAALVSLAAIVSCLVPAVAAAQVVNEVRVDPGGADPPYEYVELRGTPNSDLTGMYFVALEGDGHPQAGTADLVVNLGTACAGACALGPNGLLVIGATAAAYPIPPGTTYVGDGQFDAGALENGTISLLLVSSPTAIVEGTDYDADSDGALELPGVLRDSFALGDGTPGDAPYGVVLSNTGTADAATRFPDDLTAFSSGAWYFGASELTPSSNLAYAAPFSANFPHGGILTPGGDNVGDVDDDGVGDATDNCPSVANGGQTNTDGANDRRRRLRRR